jgi:hypothetical protein
MMILIRVISLVCLFALNVQAQQWQTASANSGNSAFHAPDYPLIFVAAKNKTETIRNGGRLAAAEPFGLDVLAANAPKAGNELWILLPNGSVKKLFPLPVHANTQGLIDTPNGAIELGSVVEPNISEDGKRVYFAYFHEAERQNVHNMSYLGADLYTMELEPIINNNSFNPANLEVRRLTDRFYTTTPQGNIIQDPASRNQDAMNPIMATGIVNSYGTVNMHAVEMRTKDGLKLVYVSDKRALNNSNRALSSQNHNFNLHIADINPDGSLGADKQFQYYTKWNSILLSSFH